MLGDWKPRPRSRRMPYGYDVNPANPKELIPIPEIVSLVEDGFDQLDSGVSLREVSDYVNSRASALGYKEISHSGIHLLRRQYRPGHIKKISMPSPTKIRMTKEERSKYRKRSKLTSEKKSLAHAKRRIQKQEEALGLAKKEEAERLRLLTERVVEVTEYDYESIPKNRPVVFQPHPGPQEEFLSSMEQEVLYGGAAGGGKSYAMLADPMRYFGNPNFNGLLLRRTTDELRELVMSSHVLYKGYHSKARWQDQKNLWTFPSGAQLWLTYLDRDAEVMRYQGQAFSWIGIDELTQYSTPFAWNYLRSRLRTADPTLPLYMRATTNPGGPGHGWVKRMFIDPASPNTPFDALDEDGNPMIVEEGDPDFPPEMWGKPLFQRRFIPAKLSDNPSLDWRYRANLRSLSEGLQRQLIDGDWNVADGAAFSEFRTKDHVCKPFAIPPTWNRFRSCDYGYGEKSASAVHWYAVDPVYGVLYVYRELYVRRQTGKALAHMILELERGENISYGVLDSSVWRTTGQTGPTIAEEMINEGCRWRPSDRSPGARTSSKNRLHELLKIDPLSGYAGIIFFDTCRQIISDLPVIPAHPDGKDDIDDRYTQDHAYDSIRYGIQTRPKATSGWDWGSAPSSGSFQPADRVFGY